MNKNTIQKIFYNDKYVLLLSVIASFILWVFIAIYGSEDKPVTISDIPVTVTLSDSALDDGLRVFGGQDVKAEVSVVGSRIIVGQLTKSNIQIVAQQATTITAPGSYTLELTAKKSGILTDYDFSSGVTPGFINVFVDRYREAEFTVESTVDYQSDTQYFVSAPILSSPKITVSGPESEISKVKRVAVSTKIPDTLKQSTTIRDVPIVMYDSYDEVISSDLINLSVDTEEITVPVLYKKTLPLKAVFTNAPQNNPFDDSRISLETEELEIAGPESMFEDYNEILLSEIDFSRINPNNNVFEQEVVIPAGCKNISNIYKVKVTLNTDGIRSKTVNVKNFAFENKADDKTAKVNTNNINVIIVGPYNEINSISSDDITGIVNLKDKESFTGSTEIGISFEFSNYESCWAYGEYNVNIEVSQGS